MTPSRVGVGLRNPHLFYFSENKHNIPLLEIHAENFFNPHGREYHLLDQVNEHYPLSFHGVGLSLGSIDGLNKKHLAHLKELNNHFKPKFFSEHISWSEHQGHFYNDLIAMPYNDESLQTVCRNINQLQDCIGRQVLVENPSSYISFKESTYAEADFLNKICKTTNCGLLLDINNIYVSSHNLKLDSAEYIATIATEYIGEIHIAGPEEIALTNESILIDSHSSYPTPEALKLLKRITQKTNAPIILEWDRDIPEVQILLQHANQINEEINAS